MTMTRPVMSRAPGPRPPGNRRRWTTASLTAVLCAAAAATGLYLSGHLHGQTSGDTGNNTVQHISSSAGTRRPGPAVRPPRPAQLRVPWNRRQRCPPPRLARSPEVNQTDIFTQDIPIVVEPQLVGEQLDIGKCFLIVVGVGVGECL